MLRKLGHIVALGLVVLLCGVIVQACSKDNATQADLAQPQVQGDLQNTKVPFVVVEAPV